MQLMAYPAHHWFLTWGGSLPGGETFTNTLRISDPNYQDGTPDTQQAIVDAYAAPIATWFALGQISSDAVLQWVKMNWVSPEKGLYINNWTNRHDFTPAISGGGTTRHYPNQVALALTLSTEYTRGLAHQGRVYLPSPTATVDSLTGVMSEGQSQSQGELFATLITALNAVDPARTVQVMSKVRTGAAHDVVSVNCGRVLDTMRSRRSKLLETPRYPHAI
jgi:hypothetical protein